LVRNPGSRSAALNVALEHNEARRNVFNDLVAANLKNGLYVSQLKCIFRAAEDPRVTEGHFRTLVRVMKHTNYVNGMAYPGRARIAAEMTHYDKNRVPRPYREQTIANYLSDLIGWGYLLQDKRAADGEGRAIAHYTTAVPDTTDLEAAITKWCL